VTVTFTLQLHGVTDAAQVSASTQKSLLTALAAVLSLPRTQLTASAPSQSSASPPIITLSVMATALSFSFAGEPGPAVTHLLEADLPQVSASLRSDCNCNLNVILLSVVDIHAPTLAPTDLPFPSSYSKLTANLQFMLVVSGAVTFAVGLILIFLYLAGKVICPCIFNYAKRMAAKAVAKVSVAPVKRELTEETVRLLIQEQLRQRDIEEVEHESKMEETRFASKPPPI